MSHRILLGELCLRLGRKQEAKQILTRTAQMDPGTLPRVKGLLGSVLSQKELDSFFIQPAPTPFHQDASAILSYPFKGNGPVLLIGGGLVFSVFYLLFMISTLFAWIMFLFIAGYMSSYMITIIDASAQGKRNPPDFPDYVEFWDSILNPFGLACAALLIPVVLPAAYLLALGHNFGVVPFIVLGLIYLPMALIVGAVSRNGFTPLNVPLVVKGITITYREYFPAILVVYGLYFVDFLIGLTIEMVLPALVSLLVVQTIGLYFLMVEMNILGRIYYNHRFSLGWFRPRRARTATGGPPAPETPEKRTTSKTR